MKHLKTYKLFESDINFTSDIMSDIKDISLEFDENDLRVHIDAVHNYSGMSGWNFNTHAIKIYLRDKFNRFYKWSDIEEGVLRLEEYVNGYPNLGIVIEFTSQSIEPVEISDFLESYADDEFFNLCVVIYDKEMLKGSHKKFETIGYTELTDEMWSDMSDILLELADEGFRVNKDVEDLKKVDNKLCEDVVEIVIDRWNQKFNFTQIEEPVRRLIDYMLEKRWNYSIMCHIGYSFHSFECGGEHPFAKIEKSFRSGSERDLHRSILLKNIKDTGAIKVVFYTDIERIIN